MVRRNVTGTSAIDCGSIIMTSSLAAAAASGGGSKSQHDVVKVVLQTLVRQLPPHDFERRHCTSLRGDDERKTMEEFAEARIRLALGKGLVKRRSANDQTPVFCHQCSMSVLPGQLTVTAGRATVDQSRPPSSQGAVWHIDCFVCWCCREPLVEQIYFWSSDNGRVYCGRHHAETLRPRCSACDEIIFADECTEADGQFWHIEHFRCAECRLPLGGRRYVLAGYDNDCGGQSYCFRCYHALLADFCRTCGQIVEAGQRHVTLTGTGCWHAEGDCFRCDVCRRSLVGRPFLTYDGDSNGQLSDGSELFCSEKCCFSRNRDALRTTRENRIGQSAGDIRDDTFESVSTMSLDDERRLSSPSLLLTDGAGTSTNCECRVLQTLSVKKSSRLSLGRMRTTEISNDVTSRHKSDDDDERDERSQGVRQRVDGETSPRKPRRLARYSEEHWRSSKGCGRSETESRCLSAAATDELAFVRRVTCV